MGLILTFSGEITKIQNIFNLLIASAVTVRCILILQNSRSDEQPLTVALQKCKKILLAGIIAITLQDTIAIIQTAFFSANIDNEGKIFDGSILLLNTLINSLMALDLLWTVFDSGIGFFQYMKGTEEEKEIHLRRIKKTIIIGVIILSCSGIVKVLLQYFGG